MFKIGLYGTFSALLFRRIIRAFETLKAIDLELCAIFTKTNNSSMMVPVSLGIVWDA